MRSFFYSTLTTGQLISSNPAAYIKVPKNAPKNIVKRTIITPEQFAEYEKQFCDSYVYIYCEEDGHITRQSKGLLAPVGEKIFLVCIRNDGRIVLHETFTKFLHGENLNAHSFHHTHATQLIESGASAKGVAGRLGHANTQITQNLYTHNTLKLQEETLAIFDKNLQTK